MFTATFLVRRRPDLEFEAFRRHSREVHAPLVAVLPGLRRYVVAFYGKGETGAQPFDSSATLEFDDAAAFEAALGSPEGAAALSDQGNFLDTGATIALTGEVGFAKP